ncbi:MAG: peptidoglycan-binding protein [Sandaracinaceae bacterium]
MAREHRAEVGECVTAIAVANGFTDRERVLAEAGNETLKQDRPNPNLLRPGDRVAIPPRDPGAVECATARKHRFVIDLPVKELRIALHAHDGSALSGRAYELDLQGDVRHGTTDGEGMVREKVRIGSIRATLTVDERVFVLRLSDLGPVGDADDEVRDVQARLHNLGYDVGSADGVYGRRTRAALAVFQAESDLEVTGEPDAATRRALEQAHGC